MRLPLAAAAAVAALAAFPPVSVAEERQADGFGVIAYTRDPDGPEGPAEPTIYVAAADGSGERAYTTGAFPSLALGEGVIAYSVRSGGAFQLVTARLDDPAPATPLTTLPDRDAEFGPNRHGITGSVWSPDRTRLAARLSEGSTTTLTIVDTQGTSKRFEFGHLFGSRIAWRDEDSLAVGTDEGLKLVTAAGSVSAVPGAAQGDTPALWDDTNHLVVNGSDGIAVIDVTSGTREPLLAGATAWDTYATTGVLYTTDTEYGLVTPSDGAETQPAVLGTLPPGQVRNAIGDREKPILEVAGADGVSGIYVEADRVATGTDVTLNNTVRIQDVVAQGATPSPPTTAVPSAPGAPGDPAPGPRPGTLAAAPGPVDPPAGRSAFSHALPAAEDVSTDAKALLVNALVTALLMLLITFPSELFNSTLEEHYDEVRGWFGRRGPRPEPARRTRGQRAAMFAGYTAAAGLLYTLLDKEAALDATTARLWLGLVVGIVVVTFTFSAASVLFHRRRGSRGVLNVLPGTLLVAVACVLITRLTRFEPGYVYGVVGGFAFAAALPEREEGRAAALSAAWVFAAALLAWLVWQPVDAAAGDGSPGLLLGLADTTLSAIAVGGVQGLVIGLLPLRSLPGHTIAKWDRRVWGAVYGVVLFVFVHLLLHPSSGFGAESHPNAFFTWLALFVGFGVVSVAFWGYFQRRPNDA